MLFVKREAEHYTLLLSTWAVVCQRLISMYDRSLTIAQNLTLLAATPARLTDLTAGLTPAQLLTPPAPDVWSARDVLAHLRACADMWVRTSG